MRAVIVQEPRRRSALRMRLGTAFFCLRRRLRWHTGGLRFARLRPEAEAYAQFRDRVGDIECDAHKRAAELEASTTARLRRTVELFRAQYVTLMSSFESTASHVTAELRKVEVNLSQLPRAMDQAGTELNELAALLDRSTKKEEKEPRG